MRHYHAEHLEKAVADGCKQYLAEGAAFVEKVPVPFRMVGGVKFGKFTGAFEARSQCDFAGFFSQKAPAHLAGRAVLVECKFTEHHRLPLSEVREKQRLWLDACPLAFVLVQFGVAGPCVLIPWPKGTQKGSLGPADGAQVAAVRFLDPLLQSL